MVGVKGLVYASPGPPQAPDLLRLLGIYQDLTLNHEANFGGPLGCPLPDVVVRNNSDVEQFEGQKLRTLTSPLSVKVKGLAG